MKTLLVAISLLGCTSLLAQNGTAAADAAPATSSHAAASRPRPDTHGVDMATQMGQLPAPAGAPGGGRYSPPTPASKKLPTLWLIGDSTVRNGTPGDGSNMGQWGWGAPLTFYFDPKKINVVNFAFGGTSSRSYYIGFWWPYLVKEIKAGDIILVQFGANDNGSASLKGVGDDTKDVTNPRIQEAEMIHSFGWYLKQYIKEGQAKGATVILVSLTPRKKWSADGHLLRDDATHAGWTAEVAKEMKVPFVPLNELIARKYDALGKDAAANMYCPAPKEGLHTGWDGAVLNAECVVAGLKALKDDPLAQYFSAKGEAIAPVDVSLPEAPVRTTAAATPGTSDSTASK